jgi:amino acid transporter
LLAAASLLVDYVLTAAVSVSAGAFAVTSAFPSLEDDRLWLALAFLLVITLANLRGAKESGVVFAIPTYGFIVCIGVVAVAGVIRCVGGCPPAEAVPPIAGLANAAVPVTAWVVLRAFSSGSTALTGIEAVADGVPAFRPPQARNASLTLLAMGVIAIAMFLSISWLATAIPGITVSQERSVLAQVAATVLGGGWPFIVVQAATAAILVLAANTAYQDFPRLSAILARDRYMPRQFRGRGSRLVFSNGIVGLGVTAGIAVVIAGDALTSLIQAYVIGVFIPFTLSQAGMVRRRLRLAREEGVRPPAGVFVNALGAVATGTVLMVTVVTKLQAGNGAAVVLMTVWIGALVAFLMLVQRHYRHVREQLSKGVVKPGALGPNHVVLLVRSVDAATAEAVAYLRSFEPRHLRVVHPVRDGGVPPPVNDAWTAMAGELAPIEPLPIGRDLSSAVRVFVRAVRETPEDFATLMVPEGLPSSLPAYLVRRRQLIRLKAGMLREPNTVVTDLPVDRSAAPRPWRPDRMVTLVFVNAVNDATLRAVNYAARLGAAETKAVFFEMDPDVSHDLAEDWLASGAALPLDILEAPYRDLPGHMLQTVRGYTARTDTLVTVVIPELIVPRRSHVLLHNQYSLLVKGLLLFEERVVVTSVPFQIDDQPSRWARRRG